MHLNLARPDSVPSDAELDAAGAHIGEVHIEPRTIFDTSRPEDNTALFRLADELHIRTRITTIQDQLLFHSGDPYRGRLSETQRSF